MTGPGEYKLRRNHTTPETESSGNRLSPLFQPDPGVQHPLPKGTADLHYDQQGVFFQGDRQAGAYFAVVNACLTVLIAAAFSRRRGQLILIDSVMGVTLLTIRFCISLGSGGICPIASVWCSILGSRWAFPFLSRHCLKNRGYCLRRESE